MRDSYGGKAIVTTATGTIQTTPSVRQVAIPILMYHSVAVEAHPRFRRWVVPPAQFAAQLTYLESHGFTAMTISHLRSAMSGAEELPPKPIALTFDDGFADFHTTVLPSLLSHQFTATLYVATAYIGGTSTWLQREGEANRLMLNWEQVRAIGEAGIEIGAHTHTHPQLDVLPDSQACAEVVQPRQIIASRTGTTPESFAYPFGYYAPSTRRLVQQAGYTSAVAVKYALSATTDDPFALSRVIVTADTTISAFASLLTTPTPWHTRIAERTRARLWQIARRRSHSFATYRTGATHHD